ncbi:ATP synthase F1 subunit gamma [Oribacterium sp. oral taxon 102]|uniref:ATP synthase F1 subunit gamma n=1 Tax=Oribacterium sp. oral taxon 102 TaxID=671214 RepID=UPI0015BD3FA0|nr:ATP synthase F1 subunit gamma [Oribacterium sp. oral taxon 102]NWO20439.1 ATP synthase F1 subunit gamma [Oribacterium sp. oral taxon 102]
MPTTRELRDRIHSIDNTMKITNAMYLISSTKMRKARADLAKTEPYFYTLQAMMARVIRHLPAGYKHPFLDLRKAVKQGTGTAAVICITADKGLAGAYNHNVLKLTEELLAKQKRFKLFVVGEMGRVFFHSRQIEIEEQFHYTAQNPTLHRSRTITRRMMELYQNREIDELYVVYTRMKNSLEMEPSVEQLLPLDRLHSVFTEIPVVSNFEEFRIFPSPDAVIQNIVPDYVNGFIYSALVEAFCSEQNARMTSMDAANRNGSELKQRLRVLYNRVRQAQITQEITEIAAGAKAQRAARARRS